jgi:hypothetical protein
MFSSYGYSLTATSAFYASRYYILISTIGIINDADGIGSIFKNIKEK